MRKVVFLSVLMLATLVTVAPSPAKQWSVVAHEWGTFTTVASQTGQNARWIPLGGPVDLPCFVNVFGAGDPLTRLVGKVAGLQIRDAASGASLSYDAARARIRATVRMETPVIYFYSPTSETVDVKVRFPQGLFTEWYPNATVNQPPPSETLAPTINYTWKGITHLAQLTPGLLPGGAENVRIRQTAAHMEWKGVRILPNVAEAYPVGNHQSHYYPARETDAVPLMVGNQMEKFLFYRGVADFQVPLEAAESPSGQILVKNTGRESIPSVILFENRDGKIGFRTLNSVKGTAVLEPVELNGRMSDLESSLEQLLVSTGLFKREAQAMVRTWKDSWFEEGARLIYILPTASVDAALPLEITPRPVNVTRTFVGRMELITRETLNRVNRAINTENEEMLIAYGRFLGPITDQLLAKASEKERTFTRKYVEDLYTAYVKKMEATCR